MVRGVAGGAALQAGITFQYHTMSMNTTLIAGCVGNLIKPVPVFLSGASLYKAKLSCSLPCSGQ